MEEKLGQNPAFVRVHRTSANGYLQEGMSRRFYAACAAMQALITNFPKERMINDGYIPLTEYSEIIKESYEFADELLKQENLQYETR